MTNLKRDIDKIVAEFTHELLSRIQLSSVQEQATVLGEEPLTQEGILKWADAHYKKNGKFPSATSGPVLSDNRGKWWGKLTTNERSKVGQKAAATRRKNSKNRKAA